MNRNIRVIAFAMHASIIIYGYALFTLSRSGGWLSSWAIAPEKKIAIYVLAGAAVSSGIVALIWPRFLKTTPPTPLFLDFSNVTPQVQKMTIVRMAVAEAVALYGFVASYLNQSLNWFLAFAAVGLFLQILVGPFGRLLRGR
ncbi:MAG TPA: hypothetical protein VFX30_03735 [bacterium]|nr:hypothetical protein [bacterium]